MKTNNDFVVYKEYKDANDLLNEVVFNRASIGPFSSTLFRGEPSINYSLLPSALRPGNICNLLRDVDDLMSEKRGKEWDKQNFKDSSIIKNDDSQYEYELENELKEKKEELSRL